MPKRTPKHDEPTRGRADVRRLRVMTDREIARTAPPELMDLPKDFWATAELVVPVPKQAISLRVDQDVLDWFKHQGPRYQSRINAVLRTYMAQARRQSPARRRRPDAVKAG